MPHIAFPFAKSQMLLQTFIIRTLYGTCIPGLCVLDWEHKLGFDKSLSCLWGYRVRFHEAKRRVGAEWHMEAFRVWYYSSPRIRKLNLTIES